MKLKPGGVSVSGFGWKFGVKLKSGGVGFTIWVKIWNAIETGGCRFQDLAGNLN